jgi:hypothetical protein
MSFINFLLQGPKSPLFEHMQYGYQLQNITVERGNDDRSHQLIATQNESLSFPNSFTCALGSKLLITINFSSLIETEKVWKSFLTQSIWTRNASILITLGCLGHLYWKHISKQSLLTPFSLMTGVAAAALVYIATMAHMRACSISSGEFYIPDVNRSDPAHGFEIISFRERMLHPNQNNTDVLVDRLPIALRTRISDFFTDTEILYLFTNVLFQYDFIQNNLKILYYLTCERFLSLKEGAAPEKELVKAYAQFRSKVDFESLKNSEEPNYSKNVKDLIESTMVSLFNQKNYGDPTGKKFASLITKYYNLKSSWELNDEIYFSAFRDVCTSIATQTSAAARLNYIQQDAETDFISSLFNKGVEDHFKHILLIAGSKMPDKERSEFYNWVTPQLLPLEFTSRKAFMNGVPSLTTRDI